MPQKDIEKQLLNVLLTHRLRGFSDKENSIGGLVAAAKSPVRYIEIDTRHTLDSMIILGHSPFIQNGLNGFDLISDKSLNELRETSSPSNYSQVDTLEEFIKKFKSQKCKAILCIDIKDFGLEDKYVDLLKKYDIVENSWIVSWIPETILRIHSLLPEVGLCFSHINLTCHPNLFKTSKMLIGKLKLFERISKVYDGNNERFGFLREAAKIKAFYDDYNSSPDEMEKIDYAVGYQHGHFLSTLPTGKMGDVLNKVSGAICVPASLINSGFIERAHQKGIEVWVFSIDKKKKLIRYLRDVNPDVVFTNNPQLIPDV